MGKGFKHGAGGGGANLNFKVVGNPRPASPSENMIWVDTDAPINGYYFSADNPPVKARNVITFPAANTQKTANGITSVYNGDGTFTLNGTLTANGDLRLIEPLELDWTPGLKYTFSARHISGTAEMADGGANTFSYGIFQNDAAKYVRGNIAMTVFPELYTFTATAFELTDTNKHLILYLQCWRAGTVFDNYRVSIMLEEGETATQPETPAEGMVWISTGVSSAAPFNALKKNNITVYPMSAKQYVSGAWVDKTAKTYQNGDWVDWIVYIVPNRTLAWVGGGSGTVTVNEDGTVSIVASSSSTSSGAGYTDAPYDLTGFNKMTVIYTATKGYSSSRIGVKRTQEVSTAPNTYLASFNLEKSTEPVTQFLDISAVNEPVYFYACEYQGTVTIKEIKLER